MRIERLAFLVFGVALIAGILIGSPVALPNGSDKVVHFVVFSLLTLCLWQATGGEMPVLADLCAALSTGALLFMQRKSVCAESSPQ